MIGSLRGTLFERNSKGGVIIDVSGVGYDVQVTGSTLACLGEVGIEVSLRIHTRVREDAITLYGFRTDEEKRCFEALITTHGVGPSAALALLTVHTPDALRRAVATEDTAALMHVPGIGKKTALRLLVELKSKFDLELESSVSDAANGRTVMAGETPSVTDVRAALASLGYGGDEVQAAIMGLPADGKVEDLLRHALRELARAS